MQCKAPFCYGCGKLKEGRQAAIHSCECDTATNAAMMGAMRAALRGIGGGGVGRGNFAALMEARRAVLGGIRAELGGMQAELGGIQAELAARRAEQEARGADLVAMQGRGRAGLGGTLHELTGAMQGLRARLGADSGVNPGVNPGLPAAVAVRDAGRAAVPVPDAGGVGGEAADVRRAARKRMLVEAMERRAALQQGREAAALSVPGPDVVGVDAAHPTDQQMLAVELARRVASRRARLDLAAATAGGRVVAGDGSGAAAAGGAVEGAGGAQERRSGGHPGGAGAEASAGTSKAFPIIISSRRRRREAEHHHPPTDPAADAAATAAVVDLFLEEPRNHRDDLIVEAPRVSPRAAVKRMRVAAAAAAPVPPESGIPGSGGSPPVHAAAVQPKEAAAVPRSLPAGPQAPVIPVKLRHTYRPVHLTNAEMEAAMQRYSTARVIPGQQVPRELPAMMAAGVATSVGTAIGTAAAPAPAAGAATAAGPPVPDHPKWRPPGLPLVTGQFMTVQAAAMHRPHAAGSPSPELPSGPALRGLPSGPALPALSSLPSGPALPALPGLPSGPALPAPLGWRSHPEPQTWATRNPVLTDPRGDQARRAAAEDRPAAAVLPARLDTAQAPPALPDPPGPSAAVVPGAQPPTWDMLLFDDEPIMGDVPAWDAPMFNHEEVEYLGGRTEELGRREQGGGPAWETLLLPDGGGDEYVDLWGRVAVHGRPLRQERAFWVQGGPRARGRDVRAGKAEEMGARGAEMLAGGEGVRAQGAQARAAARLAFAPPWDYLHTPPSPPPPPPPPPIRRAAAAAAAATSQDAVIIPAASASRATNDADQGEAPGGGSYRSSASSRRQQRGAGSPMRQLKRRRLVRPSNDAASVFDVAGNAAAPAAAAAPPVAAPAPPAYSAAAQIAASDSGAHSGLPLP